MCRIPVIILALLISCVAFAQDDKLDKYEKRDLLEGLRAPSSHERLKAAIKLQDHITKDDIELMLFGDEIKFKDGVKKIEPDLMALAVLLRGGWPDVMDEYEDDIYEIEDEEFVPIFAGYLFKYGKLSRIDEDLPICEPLRDEYYQDYIDRVSYSWIWREKYLHLGSKEWLKQRYLEDKNIGTSSKQICRLLAGDDVSDKEVKDRWTRHLKKAIDTGEKPEVTKIRISTTMMHIDAAELVAILLDKPEWLEGYQDTLKSLEYRRFNSFDMEFYTVRRDVRNVLIRGMIASNNGEIEEAKELLTPVLTNEGNEYRHVDQRIILHHPFFFRLRGSAGFVEWWKDNSQIDIVDPDPGFKSLNWRN